MSKTKITETEETTRNKILCTIIDCFQKKIDCIADGGRQVGLSEQEIDSFIAPVNKLLEAYTASIDTKTHTITILIESVLTIILMTPERLQEFTNDVQESFRKIAIDEVIGRVENMIRKEDKK